jgi:hypothetical protein
MQDVGFLNIDNNIILIQYIYNDTLVSKNYNVINDTLNHNSTFTSNEVIDSNNNSDIFVIDALKDKYGVVNYTERPYLQQQQFVNTPDTQYDKIKIYFPTSYNFNDNIGFHVNVQAYNYDNTKLYNLTNFYFDKTIVEHVNKIQYSTSPINFNGKLFGKYIELSIPSTYKESRNRLSNKPIPGTINYNLTGGINSIGLSDTSPVFVNVRFIESTGLTLGLKTYNLSKVYKSSITQFPESQSLSIKIEHSTDGDYFVIYPEYNGSLGEVENYMQILEESGNKSYIIYTITLYENLLSTDSFDIYKYEDFQNKIKYRPIFTLSNTTASIQVSIKIVNSVDNSISNKTTDYTLLNSEILKYGKNLTKINMTNVIKPKIFNAKPEQLIINNSIAQNITRRVQTQIRTNTVTNTTIKNIPVLVDTYNIIAKNIDDTILNNVKYSAQNNLILNLKPFDNIIKLKIAIDINSDNTVKNFSIPNNNTTITLTFKSDKKTIEIPLYIQSDMVNLNNGIVVFLINESYNTDLKIIRNDNPNFYITLKSELVNSVLYTGKFIFIDSQEFIINNTLTTKILPSLQYNPPNINNTVNRNKTPYVINNDKNITVTNVNEFINPINIAATDNSKFLTGSSDSLTAVNVEINPLYSVSLTPLQYTMIL